MGTTLSGMKGGGPDKPALQKVAGACPHVWPEDAIQEQGGTCSTLGFSLRALEVQVCMSPLLAPFSSTVLSCCLSSVRAEIPEQSCTSSCSHLRVQTDCWAGLPSFTPGPSRYGTQAEGVGNPGISNAGWDASFQEGLTLLFFSKIPFSLSNGLLTRGLPGHC